MKSPEKTAFETILIIAVILAIVMLPLAAKAQSEAQGEAQGDNHQPPSFIEFDTNGDGFVSEQEFYDFRAQRMTAMAAAGKPMKGAETAPDFNQVDTNGDGKISEAELVAAQQAHHAAMKKGHGKGNGKQHRKQHGKGMNMPSFGDLDTNGDGCIDAEEFATHQASHHPKN